MPKVVFTNTYKYGKVGITRFEWDPLKDLLNIEKHGISFVEAIEAFEDPDSFDLKDDGHSETEPRRYWIGKITDGRVVTVRFTVRANIIRIFGAGQWRYFRRRYYEKTKHKRS